MRMFRYAGAKAAEISFPLGGIGSGCIGLGGDGRLRDWEIFNRPNKNSSNGFSHFAVKAERAGSVVDARVLAGELQPPYSGGMGAQNYAGFGFGPARQSMGGFPNFRSVVFRGAYPFAELSFRDPAFPGEVLLRAFNPLIPLNDRDSSLPAAFFTLTFRNPTADPLTFTAALTVHNPLAENTVNTRTGTPGATLMTLRSSSLAADSTAYGNLAFGTDAAAVSGQEYWFRGSWFDNLGIYWRDFIRPGALENRCYEAPGKGDHATLAVRLEVPAGASGQTRFVLAWHYPNCTNYWNPEPCTGAEQKPKTWRNHYATLFPDAAATAAYALGNWDRLEAETTTFADALLASTLPPALLDAVSANLSILKSPTVLRLEDGSFYGWEGCHCGSGCCEGSCTHVWNYAYALPFLFPSLERSMRDLNYRFNQREDGGLVFRLKLPLGRDRGNFRPCVDGQFGDVIKMYRDWKISGDTAWLRRHWPAIRKSIAFAWAETNEDRWDADRDGVLEGRQHHTLDMELFGPNAWLTGFYLAALKAGAEMADSLGDAEMAATCRGLFAKGKAWADANLFNGQYYQQNIDLGDKRIVDAFKAAAYWNDEHQEIKYQIGEGCGIDQVLAQWHANLCGLGEIFDPTQVRQALRTIYRHNYKRSFRTLANPCRLYSLYGEKGTVICDWPEGRRKPVVPVPYAEETMYGFEYAVAAHMIQEGLVAEGTEIAAQVRARFDGRKRNPWNEFECGSNYARSMASYALLNAYSGFVFDRTRGLIGFSPAVERRPFSCFWSLDGAWGTVRFTSKGITLRVLNGTLVVAAFGSADLVGRSIQKVVAGRRRLAWDLAGDTLRVAEPLRVDAGQALRLAWQA